MKIIIVLVGGVGRGGARIDPLKEAKHGQLATLAPAMGH